MEISDIYNGNNQPKPENTDTSATADSISKEENSKGIIESGIENGDFSGVNTQLDDLLTESQKKQYVFPPLSVTREIIRIIIYSLFSCAFISFFGILIVTLILSGEHRILGILGSVVSATAILINIQQIISAVKEISFVNRYNKYFELLKHHTVSKTNDIASYTNTKHQLVIRDLNKAIKTALIPQGHFGSGSVIFIVSDELYEHYLDNQAAYDRYFRKQIEKEKEPSNT